MTRPRSLPPTHTAERIWHEMDRVIATGNLLIAMAEVVKVEYENLEEASLTRGASDDLGIPTGGMKGHVANPTQDIAFSGMHGAMRSRLRQAAAKIRDLEPDLQEIQNLILSGWSASDPGFRETLRLLRDYERQSR